jgi:hypothetical protein
MNWPMPFATNRPLERRKTDATRTCELLVGLRDVTVLGLDERLRQPDEFCVDLQHPGSIALSRSQKVQVPLFDVAIKVGYAPEVPRGATSGVLEMSSVEALATPARCAPGRRALTVSKARSERHGVGRAAGTHQLTWPTDR